VLAAVLLLVGGVAGTASYYIVELPFLRLKPGWKRAAPPARPAPEGAAAPMA
jgi:peptidoglycan/LPS O-acetylase OafA/YrhL